MITIIGTRHTYDLSNKLIEVFDEISPDVICVEMSQNRYEQSIMKFFNKKEYKKKKPFIKNIHLRLKSGQSAKNKLL